MFVKLCLRPRCDTAQASCRAACRSQSLGEDGCAWRSVLAGVASCSSATLVCAEMQAGRHIGVAVDILTSCELPCKGTPADSRKTRIRLPFHRRRDADPDYLSRYLTASTFIDAIAPTEEGFNRIRREQYSIRASIPFTLRGARNGERADGARGSLPSRGYLAERLGVLRGLCGV